MSIKPGDILKEWVNDKGKPMRRIVKECPRCGGSGHYSFNLRYGTVCFKCGGDRMIVVEERVLTEKEKLQREKAKERAREKRKQENAKKIAEQHERNRVAHNKQIEREYFKENKCIWVCENGCYGIKERLKRAGAQWCNAMSRWYFTEYVEEFSEVIVAKLVKEDILYLDDEGWLRVRGDIRKVIERKENKKV